MWGDLVVPKNACINLHCDDLDVYIRQVDDEWLFARTFGEKSDDGSSDTVTILQSVQTPSDLVWFRVITGKKEKLEVTPVLPDRPLVIRPESPVLLLPGRHAQFYIALPVWLSFAAVSGKTKTVIQEIALKSLSNTWFGDQGSGEFCYSLDSPLMRIPDQLHAGSSRVICPLIVRNGSKEKLDFERICVHVENLSIFRDGDDLWTNEIKMLFTGGDQISQITVQNEPPKNLPNALRISGPREVHNRNVIRRSFGFIRQFAGF